MSERNWSEFSAGTAVVFKLGDKEWTGILRHDVFGLEDDVLIWFNGHGVRVPPSDLMRTVIRKKRSWVTAPKSFKIIWYAHSAMFCNETWLIVDQRSQRATGIARLQPPAWAATFATDFGLHLAEVGQGRIGRLKATAQGIVDKSIEMGKFPFA